MVGIGFIGAGGMGAYQAQMFKDVKGCRVVAVADPSAEARQQFVKTHPGASEYENYEDMIRDGKIDAVVIAVPTGMHKAVATATLTAGIPTLLEKPMARTVAECRHLNKLSESTGTFLMVAQVRRFDKHWLSWGKAVQANKIGRPVMWRSVVTGMGPGRWFMDDQLGGGPLLDGAVHNYDFANLLFGDPVSVVASSIKLREDYTAVDTGVNVVRYQSGDQLMACWTWGAIGGGLNDIIGPEGFITGGTGDITGKKVESDRLYHCLTKVDGKQKLIKGPRCFNDMFRKQAKHFLDCLRGKAECISPGTEAIKAVAVAEAFLKAAPKGGTRQVRW